MSESTPTPSEIEACEPTRKSKWSKRARLVRVLWAGCEIFIWKLSPRRAWGMRNLLLRIFGAKIGKNVRIHQSVKVVIPWHLTIGDNVCVHERAILYALGKITIGEGTEIGPLAHICAGTHDFTDPAFTLLPHPIVIGKECKVGVASFIAPNIVIADKTVLMPRCAVYSSTEPGACYQGNPGKLYKPNTQAAESPSEASA